MVTVLAEMDNGDGVILLQVISILQRSVCAIMRSAEEAVVHLLLKDAGTALCRH